MPQLDLSKRLDDALTVPLTDVVQSWPQERLGSVVARAQFLVLGVIHRGVEPGLLNGSGFVWILEPKRLFKPPPNSFNARRIGKKTSS